MSETLYLENTTAQVLNQRMKEAKKKLSAFRMLNKADFTSFVLENEPAYDSVKGGARITNAWNGRTPDIRVTELMQEYVEEIETKLKTK